MGKTDYARDRLRPPSAEEVVGRVNLMRALVDSHCAAADRKITTGRRATLFPAERSRYYHREDINTGDTNMPEQMTLDEALAEIERLRGAIHRAHALLDNVDQLPPEEEAMVDEAFDILDDIVTEDSK